MSEGRRRARLAQETIPHHLPVARCLWNIDHFQGDASVQRPCRQRDRSHPSRHGQVPKKNHPRVARFRNPQRPARSILPGLIEAHPHQARQAIALGIQDPAASRTERDVGRRRFILACFADPAVSTQKQLVQFLIHFRLGLDRLPNLRAQKFAITMRKRRRKCGCSKPVIPSYPPTDRKPAGMLAPSRGRLLALEKDPVCLRSDTRPKVVQNGGDTASAQLRSKRRSSVRFVSSQNESGKVTQPLPPGSSSNGRNS